LSDIVTTDSAAEEGEDKWKCRQNTRYKRNGRG